MIAYLSGKMIVELKTCHKCGSSEIVKNGKNASGNPKFKCKSCGFSGVIKSRHPSKETQELLLKATEERSISRGLARIFGVSHQTALNWIKKAESLPDVTETLVPYQAGDVLELDELWSFVYRKANKCWIWVALCKRTRQIVSWAIGNRDEERCQALWDWVPQAYKQSMVYSDFYAAYEQVLSAHQHQAVGKESGLTNHVERWNCTLRQRICRFVRKTLSFSKSEYMHELYLKLFIHSYNISLIC